MKKIALTMTVLALSAWCVQAATIKWGSGTTVWILDNEDSAIAEGQGFVALVYASGGTANWEFGLTEFSSWSDTSTTPTGDTIVDSFLVGSGVGFGSKDGKGISSPDFTYTYGDTYSQGDQFYMMFFDNADPTLASYYGVVGTDGIDPDNPTIYTITAGTDVGTDQFTPTSTSAIHPVPEPGTILLGLAGAGALLARRRKSKKA